MAPSQRTPKSSSQQQQQQQQPASSRTIYFGYGSNLWLHQMRIRCPSSQYLGVARLDSYKWIINSRGYANVVEVESSTSPLPSSLPSALKAGSPIAEPEAGGQTTSKEYQDEPSTSSPQDIQEEDREEETRNPSHPTTHVYGLVFSLSPSDEAALDINEGVPHAYTKEFLPCTFWAAASPSSRVNVCDPPTDSGLKMLVYIDRVRVEPGAPREEYVYRMNRGIEDAVGKGVPSGYVERVLRRYIPADDEGVEKKKQKKKKKGKGLLEEKAEKQARRFEDESGVY